MTVEATGFRLEGTVVADVVSLRAIYQTGDFYYQFIKTDGGVSRIMKCNSPYERDWLEFEIEKGAQLTVQLSK